MTVETGWWAESFVQLEGIPSAEEFGTIVFSTGSTDVSLPSIPTSEAFGTMWATWSQTVTLEGIPSEESLGAINVNSTVDMGGIPTSEALGGLVVEPPVATVALPGIPSAEAFGTSVVTLAARYDAVGAGNSSSAVPAAFNFTAALGADVFVVANTDRNSSINGATYGGVAMTEIAYLSNNNAPAEGDVKVYRLEKGGTGTPKAVLATGAIGSVWWIVNAISFTDVNEVGTPTTSFGSGTAVSQAVTGFGLWVISGGNNVTLGSFSGVTNRYKLTTTGNTQAISTVAAAGTASATASATTPWAAIFIPIR